MDAQTITYRPDWQPYTPESAKTRELTLLLVQASTKFLPEFHDWLRDNWAIWTRFREEANKIRAKGRAHYSSRTLIEYVRHETALREEGEFKIDNNAAPDMARLYMLTNPGADGFFELRRRA